MKTKNTILTFTVVAIVLFISSCASKPSNTAKEQEVMAKSQMKADEERQKMAQEKAEKSLDAVPEWALSVPQPDATGMYAIGMSDSDKIPVAIKKAQLEAEYGLAKLYNQELAGGERSSTQDSGNTSSTQYTALIEKLVDYV